MAITKKKKNLFQFLQEFITILRIRKNGCICYKIRKYDKNIHYYSTKINKKLLLAGGIEEGSKRVGACGLGLET